MNSLSLSQHFKHNIANKFQLVDLMHGGIDLQSELGHGTTTTFWLPFSKSQFKKLGSPLIGAKRVPKKSLSDTSAIECHSEPQSVNGDCLQNTAPPDHLNSRTGTGLGPTLSDEVVNEEPVQQEIDRKSVHVLVVEDKYVEIPSRARTFVSIDQVLTYMLQCYQPADRSQDSKKTWIPRKCGVERQGSPRLSVGSSQHDSPKTGYYPHGLSDACARRLSSDPSHSSS